jgi:hypothetical protein
MGGPHGPPPWTRWDVVHTPIVLRVGGATDFATPGVADAGHPARICQQGSEGATQKPVISAFTS